jgi:hypothetical protein
MRMQPSVGLETAFTKVSYFPVAASGGGRSARWRIARKIIKCFCFDRYLRIKVTKAHFSLMLFKRFENFSQPSGRRSRSDSNPQCEPKAEIVLY